MLWPLEPGENSHDPRLNPTDKTKFRVNPLQFQWRGVQEETRFLLAFSQPTTDVLVSTPRSAFRAVMYQRVPVPLRYEKLKNRLHTTLQAYIKNLGNVRIL
jgi:hypothetical protein